MPNVGQELCNVPFGEMVRNLGMAIADAQYALDMSSVRIAQLMAGYTVEKDGNGVATTVKNDAGFVRLGDKDYPLLLLGFAPTFYQFVESIIEIKLEISMHESTEDEVRTKDRQVDRDKGILTGLVKGHKSHVTTVNARHAQKYSYSAEGSSLIRTKLVPVPPPAAFQEITGQIAKAMFASTQTTVSGDPVTVPTPT